MLQLIRAGYKEILTVRPASDKVPSSCWGGSDDQVTAALRRLSLSRASSLSFSSCYPFPLSLFHRTLPIQRYFAISSHFM